jgi:hypothetical protein
VPNFCPECGSSEATSRFCSSCGYSLTSTPAPPDARTRIEETPVFRPFAPPVAETWDSLTADPWSSTTGEMTPPPVRNVATQTPVAVSETKLTAVKWLWRIFLVATIAYGFVEAYSLVNEPLFSTDTPIYFLIAAAFVALLTMAGVAASAARQVGAKTPHPALAVLLVVGAVFLGSFLAGLISPEYISEIEIASLYDRGFDRTLLYGLASLLQSLIAYLVALAPVVALSRALGDRYPGGQAIAESDLGAEPERLSWGSVVMCVLSIGVYEIITTVAWLYFYSKIESMSGASLRPFVISTIGVFAIWIRFLWHHLDFKKLSDFHAAHAKTLSKLVKKLAKEREAEARGFWASVRLFRFYLIGVVAVVVLLLLSAWFGQW